MKTKTKRAYQASIVALSASLTACATTGATFRSGVGDDFMDDPPYYSGAGVINQGPIAHVPITYQRGATQPEMFDMSVEKSSELAGLLADMNAYLESMHTTVRVASSADLAKGTQPDVHFGCERHPHDDCDNMEDDRMRLAVGRPSKSWIAAVPAALERSQATRLLVITLETGNYLPYQKSLSGKKEMRLGTNYYIDVPWLTALDKPVSVLQLTGVLVDRSGLAVRVGAEGLIAHRTNIVLSGLGAQAMITEDDVAKVRTMRRDDLPGSPLVWQVALRAMVEQLTGQRTDT